MNNHSGSTQHSFTILKSLPRAEAAPTAEDCWQLTVAWGGPLGFLQGYHFWYTLAPVNGPTPTYVGNMK